MYADLGKEIDVEEGIYTTESSFSTIFYSLYIVHFVYPEKQNKNKNPKLA